MRQMFTTRLHHRNSRRITKRITIHDNDFTHTPYITSTKMPPKGPQRTGYARTALNELSSPDNRSVVTAVTMFVVCLQSILPLYHSNMLTFCATGRCRFPPQQLERHSSAPVSVDLLFPQPAITWTMKLTDPTRL